MPRLKELDVLRGVAALNVVLFHYTCKFRQHFGHHYPAKYDWEYGKYGVELFFMISGFVIFMSLQGRTSVGDFAYKRFSRLYPAYWICVCLTFVVLNLSADPGIEARSVADLLLNLTMVQGVFNIKNIDGVYWSLIPELFFYLAMGFLYWLKLLPGIRIIAVCWLSLMLADNWFGLPFGAYLMNLKYGMFFLAGILFYRIKFNRGGWYEHGLIGVCFLAGILENPSFTCFYIFLLLFLLFYLFVYGQLRYLVWKPLLFLGDISYPLYLIHQYAGFVLMRKLEPYMSNEYLVIMITISCMLTIAWLITHFLERPVLHFLRNHSFHKKPDDADSLIKQIKRP